MSNKPEVICDLKKISEVCNLARKTGKTVALVPTMGALHKAHLKLVDLASQEGDLVVVSIFVNPTQFAPGEDFDRYPRDLNKDVELLAPRGVDIVFAPSAEDMYPTNAATTVNVSGITQHLCGAHRPGHFAGVATIVTKLFNIVGPCTSIFGRKDYQQIQVIIQMTRDLNMPVKIIGASTIRESDGLAMSSRNTYLSKNERTRALSIPKGLHAAHQAFKQGEHNTDKLKKIVLHSIKPNVDGIDYVTAADPITLVPLSDSAIIKEKILIAVAVKIGKTRLIDNTVIGEDKPPYAS